MPRLLSLAAALLLAGNAPAFAQAPADHSAHHAAVNAAEAPVTRGLNNDVGKVVEHRDAVAAASEAQYHLDMAAYDSAVMAHRAAAMSDEARHERQQRAYADAMAAWRVQKARCDKGKMPDCRKPTPNPADFY